jgi:hypothetical protein
MALYFPWNVIVRARIIGLIGDGKEIDVKRMILTEK